MKAAQDRIYRDAQEAGENAWRARLLGGRGRLLLLCVAIVRLSNWRAALGRINALERRLDASEAGLDVGG